VDPSVAAQSGLNGNAISLAVTDPRRAASEAIRSLQTAGFSAELVAGFDNYLPDNHLIIVKSSACIGWVLAFRKHVLKMPKPQFQ
jgi:hypothetical protein